MPKYFGTDGFRGEANVNLTADHAYKIGRFIGWYYGARLGVKARVVIGKDTRRSSYMFEYAIAAGLTSTGADAYLLHVTTTPSVSYVVRTEEFDCGVMISASHNPYYDNGIKLVNSHGEKMEDEVLEKIEAYIDGDEGEVRSAVRDKIGCTIDYAAGRNRYVGYLISLATRSFRGKKVGLDCGNGSSWMIAKSVFDALGAKTYVIANTPDGTNINDNCGSLHVDNLRLLVAEKHLDVGFAFDGDADRCIAVDENGEVVNGDKIIYACAVYMKERGSLAQNTVVTTKMSNLGLWRALEREDIEVIKTDVGDRWVYEAMISGGYKIGGEQSGHVIFAKYATTGDGILTALKVMEVMLESKRPLSELVSPVAEFPQITRNLRLSERKAAAADPDVLSAVADAEVEFGGDGRILLRVSGTEPVLRIMVEAQTDEACRSAADKIEAVIRKKFK